MGAAVGLAMLGKVFCGGREELVHESHHVREKACTARSAATCLIRVTCVPRRWRACPRSGSRVHTASGALAKGGPDRAHIRGVPVCEQTDKQGALELEVQVRASLLRRSTID
ncbi:hypothetical protein MRX96_007035 [Rhipicephalus microplus]